MELGLAYLAAGLVVWITAKIEDKDDPTRWTAAMWIKVFIFTIAIRPIYLAMLVMETLDQKV